MRTYRAVKMLVDGKETSTLDIYREHNTFHIFEYDENVFCGGYLGVVDYIETWKEKKQPLKDFLEASGHAVEFQSPFDIR